MAPKSYFRVLAVFGILTILPQNSFGSIQAIAFFKDYDCPFSGPKETFTETNDLFKGSWIENANSVFIVGLWKMSLGEDNAVVHSNTEPPHGRCVNRTEWPGNPKILWVEKLGPRDIMSSQIIFYTEKFYTGLHYKVDAEELEQLPMTNNSRPLAMQSYIHFSKDSWTTYTDENFRGNVSHFQPSTTAQDPYDSYNYNESMLVVVGSVKKDLEDAKDSSASKVSNNFCFIGMLTILMY